VFLNIFNSIGTTCSPKLKSFIVSHKDLTCGSSLNDADEESESESMSSMPTQPIFWPIRTVWPGVRLNLKQEIILFCNY
jgi:hypothetical protein